MARPEAPGNTEAGGAGIEEKTRFALQRNTVSVEMGFPFGLGRISGRQFLGGRGLSAELQWTNPAKVCNSRGFRRHEKGGTAVRDGPIDGLIKQVLSSRARKGSEHCENENLMAAYLESSLSPEERAEFESHVADCAVCREVLALSIELQAQESDHRTIARTDSKKTLFHFSIPIPIFGVLLLVLVLVAVLPRFPRRSGENPPAVSVSSKPSRVETVAAEMKTNVAAVITEKNGKLGPAVEEGKSEKAGYRLSAAAHKEVPGSVSIRTAKLDEAQPLPSPESTARPTASSLAVPVLQKMAVGQGALTRSAAASVRRAIYALSLSANLNSAEPRGIGDKFFYNNSGFWIDKQCIEHLGAVIVEITTRAPEYESILKQYPDILKIAPAVIHWEGKNYVLQ